MSRALGGAQSAALQQAFNAQQSGPVNLSGAGAAIGFSLFGALAGMSALQQNRAIADALGVTIRRIETFKAQLRVNAWRAIAKIGYDGQRLLSNITNAITARGVSINEGLFPITDEVERNTWAERESLERQLEAADNQKFDAMTQADAQKQNVGLAVLNAGMGGAALVEGLFTAKANADSIGELNGIRQGQYADQRSLMRADLRMVDRALDQSEFIIRNAEQFQGFQFLLQTMGFQLQEFKTEFAQQRLEQQRADTAFALRHAGPGAP